MNVPIIKLELQGMRETVLVALQQHQLEIDSYVQQALEKHCSAEAIKAFVEDTAKKAIENALKEEVSGFFGWSSQGRKAIREAVQQRMSELYPERVE